VMLHTIEMHCSNPRAGKSKIKVLAGSVFGEVLFLYTWYFLTVFIWQKG
jgi:F0F1-type ATP synthase membrane subunit c/vacuolar-type H+-ATPase subunit K